MSWSYAKKLAVVCNSSAPRIDSKEDLEEGSLDQKLETVRYITYNVKLNKVNEEVSTLIDSGSETKLISWGYTTQLPLKILDTSWDLATINKQQISTQGIVIAGFGISDSAGQTRWFERLFSLKTFRNQLFWV